MFGDLDLPLNASRGLSAIAEFLVIDSVINTLLGGLTNCCKLDLRPLSSTSSLFSISLQISETVSCANV